MFIAVPMLTYRAETDLALTYAGRALTHRKARRLALDCARKAWRAAVQLCRPDLAWRANELIAAIGVL